MERIQYLQHRLQRLEDSGDLRCLPHGVNDGREVIGTAGGRMLNLSSNDYLGLSNNDDLYAGFWETCSARDLQFSASSSRLLTGNYPAHQRLESLLAQRFGTEAALVFNSGYHANTGILPAICDARTLILADKLVHASLIDGIRLSDARAIRFRHNDWEQLERLVGQYSREYERIVVVVESIYSMDGDTADLARLVGLRRSYPNVWLYVDEAHAFGVYGANGLGYAEVCGCMGEIDFLVGTFGKAIASVGAYVACRKIVRDYLVNRMRTFIFTTALPPLNIAWTSFVVERLEQFEDRRLALARVSACLRGGLEKKGYTCTSSSHIVPWVVGSSEDAVQRAELLQKKGFYVLPVRPPTVPRGTARLRFSLTADMQRADIDRLLTLIPSRTL